jgi:tRNA threonylcarbamoyl adenosine modification protein YjeE
LGAALGEVLRPGDVILVEGDLGSGKTRLAKGIVSAATGISQDEVVSPTFTLINSFEGPFPVHHADLYRIDGDPTEGIGLDETVEFGGALIVEWAEKIRGFGEDPLIVIIRPGTEENSRRILLKWDESGSWAGRIAVADTLGSTGN